MWSAKSTFKIPSLTLHQRFTSLILSFLPYKIKVITASNAEDWIGMKIKLDKAIVVSLTSAWDKIGSSITINCNKMIFLLR